MYAQRRSTLSRNRSSCVRSVCTFSPAWMQCSLNVRKRERWEREGSIISEWKKTLGGCSYVATWCFMALSHSLFCYIRTPCCVLPLVCVCVCVGEAAVTWAAVAEWSRAGAAGRLLLWSGICSLQPALELLFQGAHGHTLAGWCESSVCVCISQVKSSFIYEVPIHNKSYLRALFI